MSQAEVHITDSERRVGGRSATSAASADASAASAIASAASAVASAANADASAPNNIDPFMFTSATSDEQVANVSTSKSHKIVNDAEGSENEEPAMKTRWPSAIQKVIDNKLSRPERPQMPPVPNGPSDGRSSAVGVNIDAEDTDGTKSAAHERVVDIAVEVKSGQ